MPQPFSMASGLLLGLSILRSIHGVPFIPQLDLPAPVPFLPDEGIVQKFTAPPTSELNPADVMDASGGNDSDLLGLEYGKCYRIENIQGERLGYKQGAYYQYGNPDGRVFQICRLSDGPCLREGGKADQKLRSTSPFYLFDTKGSSYSKGPTYIGFYGVFLYPLIYKNMPQYRAHFQAFKDCDEVDEGDPCPLAVNLKSAHNNWKGLSNYPGGFIRQVANEYENVHWVFKEVKQCKGGRHGGDDVTDDNDLDVDFLVNPEYDSDF
ncbi:hypothetical protein BJX99DRAFT_262382 [Aspergillus californicus]